MRTREIARRRQAAPAARARVRGCRAGGLSLSTLRTRCIHVYFLLYKFPRPYRATLRLWGPAWQAAAGARGYSCKPKIYFVQYVSKIRVGLADVTGD